MCNSFVRFFGVAVLAIAATVNNPAFAQLPIPSEPPSTQSQMQPPPSNIPPAPPAATVTAADVDTKIATAVSGMKSDIAVAVSKIPAPPTAQQVAAQIHIPTVPTATITFATVTSVCFWIFVVAVIIVFFATRRRGGNQPPPQTEHPEEHVEGERHIEPAPADAGTVGRVAAVMVALLAIILATGSASAASFACVNPLTTPSNYPIGIVNVPTTLNCTATGAKVEVVEIVGGVERAVIYTGTTPSSFTFTPTASMRAVVKVDGRVVSPLVIAAAKDAGLVNSAADLAIAAIPPTPPSPPSSDPRVAALQSKVAALQLFVEGLCDLDAAGKTAALGTGRGTSSPAGAVCRDAIITAATEDTLADPRLKGVVTAGVSGGIDAYFTTHPPVAPVVPTASIDLAPLTARVTRVEEGQKTLTATINGDGINPGLSTLGPRVAKVEIDLADTQGALAQRGPKELRTARSRGCSWAEIANRQRGCGGGQKLPKK